MPSFSWSPIAGGGSGGGVTTINTLSGALTIAAGAGITVTSNGTDTLTIASTSAGDVTLAAFGSTPNANAASLTGQALALQPASASFPGGVSTGTQSFAGDKTFTGIIAASNLSGTNTGDVTIGTASGLSLTGQALSLGLASAGVTGALSGTDWSTFNGKQAAGSYITALTGDATAAGPGSAALTLATVNTNVGSFGSSTAIPSLTVNAKGLVTAASTSAVVAPAGTLTGTTLASNVVTSSLTSVGTIGTGVWQGTKVGLAYGGTNADLSATGGTSQVLKQATTGAAVTVGQLAFTDISGSVAAGQMPALTGDVTTSAGAVATTIAANVVSNAKLAQMAASTIKGNNTGGTANALDLTVAQSQTLLVVPFLDGWVLNTPTILGMGTVTNNAQYSRRVGDTLEVWGAFTTGTTTAVTASITVGYNGSAANVTIDTTKVSTSVTQLAGHYALGNTSNNLFSILVPNTNGTFVTMGDATGSGGSGLAAQNGSFIAGSSVNISYRFSVPIVGWAATH